MNVTWAAPVPSSRRRAWRLPRATATGCQLLAPSMSWGRHYTLEPVSALLIRIASLSGTAGSTHERQQTTRERPVDNCSRASHLLAEWRRVMVLASVHAITLPVPTVPSPPTATSALRNELPHESAQPCLRPRRSAITTPAPLGQSLIRPASNEPAGCRVGRVVRSGVRRA